MDKWLIWSIEHSAWWEPNSNGYTGSRKSAGRYSFEEASQIVHSANQCGGDVPLEAMIQDVETY